MRAGVHEGVRKESMFSTHKVELTLSIWYATDGTLSVCAKVHSCSVQLL